MVVIEKKKKIKKKRKNDISLSFNQSNQIKSNQIKSNHSFIHQKDL